MHGGSGEAGRRPTRDLQRCDDKLITRPSPGRPTAAARINYRNQPSMVRAAARHNQLTHC